jgi:hypothetical protein
MSFKMADRVQICEKSTRTLDLMGFLGIQAS